MIGSVLTSPYLCLSYAPSKILPLTDSLRSLLFLFSNNTLHRLNSTRYTQQSVHTTATNMSTSQSQSSSTPPTSSSENLISNILKQGSERGILYISAGLVFGGLASIVLARGGGGSGARKAITAFGTGVGTGAAWTRCSIDIEDAVKDMK